MKTIRWLVIAAFVLSFAGAVWMFAGLRRELTTLRPAEAMGPLQTGVEPSLNAKIDLFLNQKVHAAHPSYVCVHDVLGRDNLFVYVDRACGEFERGADGRLGMKRGFREMARIEIDNTELPIGLAEPEDGEDHGAALVKLFPPAIRTAADQPGDPRAPSLFERGFAKQNAAPAR